MTVLVVVIALISLVFFAPWLAAQIAERSPIDTRRRSGWFSVTSLVMSVLALLWIGFFAPGMHWTGGMVKSVTIRVTEGESRRPAQGVMVIVMRHGSAQDFKSLSATDRRSRVVDLPREIVGTTSQDGTVTLRSQFPAGGTSSLLMNRGSFGIAGTVLIFKGDGDSFIDARQLEDLIPEAKRSLQDELPMVEIALP